MSLVRKGRSFGEMSLMDSESRSADAVATQNGSVLVMRELDFKRLMLDRPALAAQLLLKLGKLLSQRLRNTGG